MTLSKASIERITALIDRLRPSSAQDVAGAERNIWGEIARLNNCPEEVALLRQDLQMLLNLPHQSGFYAETGILTAMGFWLEFTKRLGQRMLPPEPADDQLSDILCQAFHEPSDHEWVDAISHAAWLELAMVLGLHRLDHGVFSVTLHEAMHALSYRLAGAALDRELLNAEPALERYKSPFLAQNATLVPILERCRSSGAPLTSDEVRDIDVLLDQCVIVRERVQRKAGENGISVRLTYLLARLQQMIDRLRKLLDLAAAGQRSENAISLYKTLITAAQTGHYLKEFMGESVSLLARNITDHASRRGEHYIATDRSAWWEMARSAAGGGIIIAVMALLKIKLSQLGLPPLTEGIAYGLNYGIGFALIHLLGFTVATKQPAMTAAAIAATLEEARPRELERLVELAQNVVRTQFVAVLGNVSLALPIAILIAYAWPMLFDAPVVAAEKAVNLLREVDPLHSGALFFAAVAGVGLFLSGLVSGYFDNQARYHHLPSRIGVSPLFAWLGNDRARRLGRYLDAHYGAILGNLFFGMYLGLVGVFGELTGLPVDIRHVAFSSANLGTAVFTLDLDSLIRLAPWAIVGIAGIAFVNLAVSFALALYVAMKSCRLGLLDLLQLNKLLMRRFVRHPLQFFTPPEKAPHD